MKNLMVINVAFAVALVGCTATGIKNSSSNTQTSLNVFGRCHRSSWSPELYSFYGTRDTVLKKLAKIPVKLADRRVFLQIIQGDADKTALVRFFEQQQDGAYTVTEWHTKRASTLLADIDREICANKGVSCVGEQIKLFLQNTKREDQHVTTGVAAPVSVQAAFAHPVNEAKGVFIKTVLTTLC